MKIVVIDYNAGNTKSVLFTLKRIGVNAVLSRNHDEILSADKVIFPGVGQASSTMAFLKEKNLHLLIPKLKQPVLGICLGMQLMCKYSEEGKTMGMGIFPLEVKQFKPVLTKQKVPHMGWNLVKNLRTQLFNSALENGYVYFVHSFYVPYSKYTIATCNYINKFSAGINNENFYAVQFHPEKSGIQGQEILNNFLKI